MKLRIGIFVLAFVWTIFPFRASAIPLAGGPHDLTSVAGAPADICRECHIPHNAMEKALYIRDLTPDTVETNDNCYDCHDANRIVLSSPPQPPTWATSAPDAGYLKGSLHDWDRTGNTQPIATIGSCSPCHDIHLPDATTASYMGTWFTTARLWTRDLSLDLAEYYQKRDLKTLSGNDRPNYLAGSTILCYDCHGGAARSAPAGDPFVPDDSDFSPAPQDVAFGGDRGVKALLDGSNVGYYELPDGYEPAGVTHVAPSMSAVRDSPDNPGNVPGGHYVLSWMGNSGTAEDDNYEVRDPDGTLLYRISIGDKLPCEMCHDPHLKESATNTQPDEVFFRRDIHTGENRIVTRTEVDFNGKLEASSHTRNGAGGVGDGRLMCIYCHGTGDWDGTQFPSTGISPLIVDWGQKLTIFGIRIRTGTYANESPAFPPPNTVPDHFEAATRACTDCHQHNNTMSANCDACHGSPVTGQYWPDGSGGSPAYVDDDAGSHDRHMLAVGQYLGYGDYTVAMYDDAQQKTICAFCHPTPGGSGHNQNTAGSPADRVDVLGDGFTPGTFTVFGAGAQTIKADTNNAAAYSQASETCSNVDCHYEKMTPAYGGSGWNGGDAAGNDPDCLTCHYYRDAGAYAAVAYTIGELPDAHQVHVAGILPPDNAQSHDYPCSYCHDVTGYTTAHTNGEIDLSDTGSPNQSVDGDPNDETITLSSVSVKYGAGSADATCANFYCHGADFSAPTQGTNVSPIWNSQSTAYCSACHDVDTRSASTFGQEFTQGRHRTHLSPGAPFVYGPPYNQHASNCSVCHGVEDNGPALTGGCNALLCHPNNGFDLPGSANDAGFATFPSRDHVEGNFQVDFEGDLTRGWNDINDYSGTPGTLSTLGTAYNNGTDICNRCHSTATVGGVVGATLAKADWNSASYRIPCENCHNALTPAQSTPVTGGIAAPGVGGDETIYGAGITGHNRTGSVYPGSGNSPAGKVCTTCHDNMKPHIDGVDGTSFSATDVRYADTINGVSMASATVVEDMCFACHQNTGADAGAQVSGHGNMNASFKAGSTHDAQAESFTYRCDACHEPHGLTVNSLSNPNIYMVKGSVEVKNYSVPGSGADETTVVPVVYEARTGTNSLDDGLTQSNNMCVVCHTSANRPGSGTALTNPNGDGTHTGLDDYSSNEQGNDCSSCHQHDYDADPSGTADGFMPLQCDSCHSYPPTSGMHDRHVGSYGFNCSVCHQNSGSHNESSVIDSTQYQALAPTVLANNIDVVFDGVATAGTYSPAKGSRTALGAGTCSGVYCHGDGWTLSAGGTDVTPEWNSASTGACGACHSTVDPGTNSHSQHLAAAESFGVNIGCSTCHTAGTAASGTHVDGYVTFTGAASGYTGSTADRDNSAALGTCGTNACHNDGTAAMGPPVRSYTWGSALTDDCASCHQGAGMATNKHGRHLASNALPGTALTFNTTDECVTCHSGTTTGGGVASGGSHLNAVRDVSFAASFGYEGVAASRTNTGAATTCSTVRCHNGVGTPSWAAASTISCGDCHHDSVVSSSPRPTWEGSVGRSHAAHADTDGVYTDCANCHTAFSANYTATGGTNHQNLVVDISPSGGSYAETLGGAGVDWSPGSDGVDDGTCSATSCHGPGTPVWGGTVACGSCHSNGMPPTSGAHTEHLAAIAGSATQSGTNTDYSECIACHGDNGDSYATGTGTHVNNIVDVAGSGVSWNNNSTAGTPDDDTCTTTVCHSPPGNPAVWGDGGKAWETSSSIGCGECHYWSATPSAANNSLDANSLSSTHGTHFDTGYYCTDCHGALPVDDAHITSPVGSTDGQVLVNRANAVMDEASIASSVLGVGGSDPDPGNAVCDNTLCHNPSNDSHAATWQVSNAQCALCHADTTTGPLSGSHGAHIAATATYGRVIVCGDCHTVPGAAAYGHRDGVVNLSALAGTGYQGSPSYPFGAPYGSCDTTTCHNDGTGVANPSPVWGTTVSQPACGLCHSASPATNAHVKHLAYPGVSGVCTVCHTSQTTVNHINNTVSLISTLASSYTGSVNVGDGGKYGSCSSGACHDAVVDIAWNATPTNCDQCHYNGSDVNNFNGRDKTASVVGSGEWTGAGHGSKGKVCLDCHSLTSAGHDFSATLGSSSNPYRFDTSAGAFTCSNATAGCHQAGTKGPATGLDISTFTTHSSAEMAAAGYSTKYTWSFAPECVNCHDPHGDGSNLSMIQSQLYDKEAFSVTSAAPSLAIDNTTLVFTDDTTGLTSTQEGYADYTVYSSVCQECHEGTTPGTDTTFAFVDNARANFSGHPGYVNTSSDNPGDCSTCHQHDSAFKPSGCPDCHGPGGNGPTVVWPSGNAGGKHTSYGSHVGATSAEESDSYLSTVADWNFQCNKCHNQHTGTVTVRLPPTSYTDGVGNTGLNMQNILGIDYSSTGHGFIKLGGTATAGTYEAQLCWNCHGTNTAVNEWGTNTSTNGLTYNYNYGSLDVSNWFNASWTDGAGFIYKNGPLTTGLDADGASIHAASFSAAGPGIDDVQSVRCSYCHDVHDLNKASRTIVSKTYSDSMSGPPYLRGTWMGSPYPEDGAPITNDSAYYGGAGNYGRVPRAGTVDNESGGYQIDQNNSNPTTGGVAAQSNPVSSAWALSNSAGLCVLCHSDNVDDMNQFGSPGGDWYGTNGHSNAVIGGTGANAANIFRTSNRHADINSICSNTRWSNCAGEPTMSYRNSNTRGYGFRSRQRGWNYNPQTSSSQPYAYQGYDWGAAIDDTTTDLQYHKFPCSKCHTPHASRLPRLMITNCLDTRHNTWDDRSFVSTLGPTGTPNSSGSSVISDENGSVTFSNATSAQNCHRRKDSAFTNSLGPGWNNVTPW